MHLVEITLKGKRCEIYVEHGLDDPELVTFMSLPAPETVETEIDDSAQAGCLSDIELNFDGFEGGVGAEKGGEVGSDFETEGGEDNDGETDGGPYSDEEKDGGADDGAETMGKQPETTTVDEHEGNESVYYDSDDPPTIQEENDNDVGEEVQSSRMKSRYPIYNPKSDPPQIELGMLFDDNVQFKNAMISYVVHNKRDICWEKMNINMSGLSVKERVVHSTVVQGGKIDTNAFK
ncbi:PREDICTED: uncharacterized protein LOC109153695 [Ipomoea nil]|uniref:uncharacterized protein LOC109153695 n=1 Tax=Ipomoea nil TaxID=35883 RepID=UPI0009018569|nr:PREDICTED: uncharacterized protein LOC109153695 [Ipomoea nil]